MLNRKNLRPSPWLIWGLGAAFFFAEYYARVAPSVMAQDLMQAFQVNAFALGGLSAFFYYAYISMQLPVGMMMDKYGPHRLLTITALICAVGAFVFTYAINIYFADFGRLLMGFGAAFAFVGSLKLASVWFPSNRFGLMAGLTQAIGMLGAATGEGPMSLVVQKIGWQNTMLLIAVIFILLAIAIGLIVRDAPASATHPRRKIGSKKFTLMSSLRLVAKNPQSWVNALYAGFIYAPTAAFAELWGVSYLERAYQIDVTHAATAIGLIFIGWGIGGPLTGYLSDYFSNRKPFMIFSAIAGFVLLTLVLYVKLPLFLVFILLFIYGMTNTGVSISYAVASEINPHHTAGTSMALANMASVIIGASFQPLIGWLLVKHWNGGLLNNIPYYTTADYQTALILLPLCSVLGLITVFFVKETRCQKFEARTDKIDVTSKTCLNI